MILRFDHEYWMIILEKTKKEGKGAVGIGFIVNAFDLNIAIQIVGWISLGSNI